MKHVQNVQNMIAANKCTGCFACANACPADAIQMKLNAEGFFIPVVSVNTCLNCGKCVKVCPAADGHQAANPPLCDAWAFQADDKVRLKSSSGGAFYHLASSVIEAGGIVFGAAFDAKGKIVRHMSSEEVSLEKLLRSKYVQSKIGDCYRQVKKQLQKGRKVLFAGTPCQVSGLLLFLGEEYQNLLTVDFVCHGVPSTGLFKETLEYEEQTNKKQITDFTFREKDRGWRTQTIKLYFSDGSVVSRLSKDYFYYRAFLNGVSLRNSCFECHFPRDHRSDITLLDLWQSKDDDDRGITGCSLNTEQGKELFFKACPGAKMVQLNPKLTGAAPHSRDRTFRELHWARNYFYRNYAKYGLKQTLQKCVPHIERFIGMRKNFYNTAAKVKYFIHRSK